MIWIGESTLSLKGKDYSYGDVIPDGAMAKEAVDSQKKKGNISDKMPVVKTPQSESERIKELQASLDAAEEKIKELVGKLTEADKTIAELAEQITKPAPAGKGGK